MPALAKVELQVLGQGGVVFVVARRLRHGVLLISTRAHSTVSIASISCGASGRTLLGKRSTTWPLRSITYLVKFQRGCSLWRFISRNTGLACSPVTGVGAIIVNVTPKFRSEEHTSELQSRPHLVCRLLLE